MWPYLEINKVFIDKNQVKVKSLVWALIQCDQLPYMNRQVPLEDIEVQEEGHEQYTISNARSEES